jgi:hypothetical protein
MTGCPDFGFIRRQIPIVDVARKLGIRVNGYRAHCWRMESHRNGDADPSIGFLRRRNIGKCFVCDSRAWSTIDLVMFVRRCELREAVTWITARYSVPAIPKGYHIEQREAWCPRFRASDTVSVLETLVRSGLWSELTNAQRSILPALVTFAEPKTGVAEISYRGLMRFAGVGSQATIASALKVFQQMGFLRVEGAPGTGPTRRVNRYILTFDDPGFQSLVMTIYQQHTAEIALERALRAEARKARLTKKPICTG